MDLELGDSIALVIAGSSGLGKAAATAFAREGADVAICARGASGLETARTEIDRAGAGDVLAVQTDITDPDELDALVETVTADLGGLDHLVTSAGVPASRPFFETAERDWYTTYDQLLMSVVWLAKRAYPFLAESEAGTLVAIASTDAREPVAGEVLSSTVRRGLVGLAKTLALEWAPEVRVNTVLPGPHRTPGLEEALGAAVDRGEYGSLETAREDVRERVPLETFGDSTAFGDLVAMLSSDRARFVTGSAVPIDGGMLRS